jgi:hypothetical protein
MYNFFVPWTCFFIINSNYVYIIILETVRRLPPIQEIRGNLWILRARGFLLSSCMKNMESIGYISKNPKWMFRSSLRFIILFKAENLTAVKQKITTHLHYGLGQKRMLALRSLLGKNWRVEIWNRNSLLIDSVFENCKFCKRNFPVDRSNLSSVKDEEHKIQTPENFKNLISWNLDTLKTWNINSQKHQNLDS